MVGTDGSRDADIAVKRAMTLASEHDAALILVHVCVVRAPLEDSLAHRALVAALERECVAMATEHLDGIVTEAKSLGIDAEHVVRVGTSPAATLVEVARETGADLVVTGARGVAGSNVFVIGSVSEGVVRRSTTNVLVVRDAEHEPRVMVATDLTDASKATLAMGTAFAESDDTVELFHVIDWADRAPPFHGAHGSAAPDFKKLWRAAREEADKLMAQVTNNAEAHTEHRIVEGVAATEILERAKAAKPRLLVLGKHTDEPPVHQRVVERVVRHSTCSVLVARKVPTHLR